LRRRVRRRLAELGKPIKFLEGPGLSEGTLSHFFKGDFTDNTLTKIETRMETTFSSSDDVGKDAPPEMGGYSFSFNEVEDLQGAYLYVHPLFSNAEVLNAYMIDIIWDNSRPCLAFRERERADAKYATEGNIYRKKKDPFLTLLSIQHDEVRNILVKVPDDDGVARGLMLTAHHVRGAQFVPVATYCFLKRVPDNAKPHIGYIKSADSSYLEYQEILKTVASEDLGRLIHPV